MTDTRALDALAIDTIRVLSMDAVEAAQSGHPGTPMALAPLGWAIFSRLRKHNPANPQWVDRDRFVLSCGHASMLQYALLHLSGYALSLDEIRRFRQWESLTPGHPEVNHTPGVEITTGPLGQGMATAVGMAMAERHLAARFNKPEHNLVDHRVWVIASDGDIMEGVSAEASSLAGHLKLGKLIVFWDDNRITIDGSTDLSFSENVCKRYEAYGWHVQEVEDGASVEALCAAAERAVADERPSFIRVRTIIGFPAPTKQNTSDAHGAPLGAKEIAATREVMKWKLPAFETPAEISKATQAIVDKGQSTEQSWKKMFDAYRAAHPDLAAAFENTMRGQLPSGWDQNLPVFEANEKGVATRKASGEVLNALAKKLEGLVGGSADLAGSNNSTQKGQANFLPGSSGVPRNVDWGVREHAMAAAVNGMALHGGVIPYAATFLIFSDYMRPALRLAALMKQRTRYIFTHDSIGLGEDGPTHQPIEQLAVLRAIPGFAVLRPGDANETRVCWQAMLNWEGPAALALTRQNLPTLDRKVFAPAENAARGAYILSEDPNGAPQLSLVATGSEVSLAIKAAQQLRDAGVRTRIVSMPCWELFAQQTESYQQEVLPKQSVTHVVIEAGIRQGWERWVGSNAGFVTLEHFGASAPYEVLFEKFGFGIDNIVRVAKDALARSR